MRLGYVKWMGLWAIVWGTYAVADVVTLSDYLSQVERSHLGIKALGYTQTAISNLKLERNTPNQPRLVGQGSIQFSKNYGPMAQFTGPDTQYQTWAISVAGESPSGFGYDVGYSLNYFGYVGSMFGIKSYYQASPYVQITYPLWNNHGGKRTQQSIRGMDAHYDAMAARATSTQVGILAMAESTYWRLALARESVLLSEDALDRARRLVEWTRQRQARALGDAADLAQAQALQKTRELELEMAKSEKKQLELDFNWFRGSKPESAVGSISTLTDAITSLKMPVVSDSSSELRAEMATTEAELARLQSQILSGDPVVNLVGRVQLNPVQSELLGALTHSFATDYPTYTLALQYVSGLDLSLVASLQEGYQQAKQAAHLQHDQKRRDRERQLIQLRASLKASKERLETMQALEGLMQTKWGLESQRHRNGRSTMAQVLTAEQDYKQVIMQKLRTKAEIVLTTLQLQVLGR